MTSVQCGKYQEKRKRQNGQGCDKKDDKMRGGMSSVPDGAGG